ncbi:hypothetical protein BUALT_Bualt09G0056000 [Buddleja alternifolia]|uniref:Beta-glucosidase n=1 Tax=Buddleja alternifolia TaxID=168488 RepID=A0AAV6X4M7_9LAMI|nr:hypothetical protein BUALT_Bualt09G0056000 [Buddleja alternifolia]
MMYNYEVVNCPLTSVNEILELSSSSSSIVSNMAPHLISNLIRFIDGSSTLSADEPVITTPQNVEYRHYPFLGMIFQSTSADFCSSSTSPRALRNTLETSISSHSSHTHILNLTHQLYNLEQGDIPTTAYLHKAKHISDQLAAVGRPITLSEFNIFVFKGLRAEFKDLVITLAARPGPVNFHELHSLLISHEFINGGSFSSFSISDSPNYSVGVPTTNGGKGVSFQGPDSDHGYIHKNQFLNNSQFCQWCANPGHTAKCCSLLQQHFSAPPPAANLPGVTDVQEYGGSDRGFMSTMKNCRTMVVDENIKVKQVMKDDHIYWDRNISTVRRIKDDRSNMKADGDNSAITRNDFPDDFVFGTATSAYQFEGAAAEGDRIFDGSNGNVAVDMYHRYKDDVEMMKKMGFDACRISISWSRILPGGRKTAGINKEGINFYNDLINTFLAHGIEPYVTLFHWDLPYCLEQEYAGFLSEKIVDDFRDFVELCFWEFGDRVKSWITLNEPWSYCTSGYVSGKFPPSKASAPPDKIGNNLTTYRAIHDPNLTLPANRSFFNSNPASNPATDAYTVARNLLLAHSAAVQSYRTKFQEYQEGKIGMVLCCQWYEPFDENSKDDIAASKRAMDFMMGWFLEPVLTGRYPQSMMDFVPSNNLAQFSEEESKMLKGSIDFMGLNYYTANYVAHDFRPQTEQAYYRDQKVAFYTERDGQPIGPRGGSTWLYIVPSGVYKLLKHINNTYKDMPPIYISENGVDELNDFKLTAVDVCADKVRVKYHQDHLANILKAMKENVNVKGYFVWAWCDNFEWYEGYTVRFGLVYIDFMNNLTRIPKNSAVWFTKFLQKRKQSQTKNRISDKTVNGKIKLIKD